MQAILESGTVLDRDHLDRWAAALGVADELARVRS